jgi:hypothetical protein
VLSALAFGAGRLHAQSSPVATSNATLRASLERIAKGSPLWREAFEALGRTGRQAIVVTPDQLHELRAVGRVVAFDETMLAEIAPVVSEGTRVDTVIVVVNLALLRARHHDRRSLPIEFDIDLDRIVVHEVYGHAVPYLLAGDLSGRCADPQPRERAVDACSIQRENAVRAELGLGRRVDYGLYSLSLARRH